MPDDETIPETETTPPAGETEGHAVEAAPVAAEPPPAPPAPVLGVDRFRAEFMEGGSLKPLQWATEAPAGAVYRVWSSKGFLCFQDGSQIKFDNATEAGALVGLLQPIRPLDNIQLHTS